MKIDNENSAMQQCEAIDESVREKIMEVGSDYDYFLVLIKKELPNVRVSKSSSMTLQQEIITVQSVLQKLTLELINHTVTRKENTQHNH